MPRNTTADPARRKSDSAPSSRPTAGNARVATSRRSSLVRPSNVANAASGVARTMPSSQPSQTSRKLNRPSTASQRSRSPTPESGGMGGRTSSVVLESSVYRYSLNVGSVSRFPANAAAAATVAAGVATSGGGETLAQNARRGCARLGDSKARDGGDVDPSRASVSSSVSSSGSHASSRMSSRYLAEEVAPQRRPVYLALPSDPGALGPWSSASDTKVGDKHASTNAAGGKMGRRNSKIMTSFPFPHPVTPRRRGERSSHVRASSSSATDGIGAAWQRLLTAIFAGPYERQLNREEQQDDRITQSIIHHITQRNTSHASNPTTLYGTIPITPNTAKSAHSEDSDPYGYRRLAGPHLLPSYTTHLVARRRERRRARSRARFQCMALWTIWTVSILLVLIVLVLLFSFCFPDRLRIPNHNPDNRNDDHMVWFHPHLSTLLSHSIQS